MVVNIDPWDYGWSSPDPTGDDPIGSIDPTGTDPTKI